MKVLEILLDPVKKNSDLSSRTTRQIDFLKKRMSGYVDKICDTKTTPAAREFLKSKLRDDWHELKSLSPKFHSIEEAVHKLPVTNEDFNLLKDLMQNPIPAAVAPIYIQEIINDDEFNDLLLELEDSNPNMDVRPLIAEWIDRVMPDQKHRFTDTNLYDYKRREGLLSPIHGFDAHMYKGTNDPITGDAYGRY